MRVLGIDVGGTTIKALPVFVESNPAGEDDRPVTVQVLGEGERRPTPASDPEAVLATIVEIVRTHQAALRLDAIGIAVPGIIDEPRGVAVLAANLGWADTPVAARIGDMTGLPVALGHDVRAGGLAEWRLGAGRGEPDLLLVMLGTGIGAAVVTDGRLLTASGYAGQLGHVIVERGDVAVECGCGQRGCLATVASASAIVRRYVEAGGDDPDAAEVTEAREVVSRAAVGEQRAVAVWESALDALADALVTAVTLLGPRTVVLGGGLALAGDRLLTPLAARLEERLTFQRRPRLVPAQLGDESAILGAALLAGRSG